VKLGQLPSSVSVFTADEVDGVLAMLCEHAPQGLDSGFEDQGVDSLRYVLERSPTECAEALLLPYYASTPLLRIYYSPTTPLLRTSPHRPTPTSPSPDY
jgi:hypothetical protein